MKDGGSLNVFIQGHCYLQHNECKQKPDYLLKKQNKILVLFFCLKKKNK